MSEIHRRDPSDEIIVNPENWEEMKKKYLEREEEQIQKVLARRKAESQHELANIATKAIVTRATRAAPEHKPLKDHTILVEPKSEEIQELKQQLHEEITAITKRILQPHGEPAEHGPLKGRVTQAPPPQTDVE